MKKRLQSFSGRLTRSVVLTVLVIMTIISVFVFIVTAAGLFVYSRAHCSDIMDKAKGNMAMIMSKVEVSAENIIDELSWHLTTPDVVISTLQYELNTNRHVYGCGMGFVPDYFRQQGTWFEPYAFHQGDTIGVRNIGSEAHDYFTSEWYVQGLESTEGVWSNPYHDPDGADAILCTFSRRVTDPEGKVAGVFGADMNLDELSTLIEDQIKKENEANLFMKDPFDPSLQVYCFIISQKGDYIVHPDKTRILRASFYDYAGDDADRYLALGDAMRAGGAGEKKATVDGIKSFVYFAPLLNSGWSMGIVVPTRRLLMPSILFGSLIMLLILLGLLIVFAVCHHSIRKATKPLMRLAESAREVAQGKFDTELPEIKKNDEIRLLRDSFDNMQQSLARYVEELTETTAQKASMESELDVARKIQMSMLPMTWPAFPERKDLDIFGSVAPAKAVGGDLFDFSLRDGKLFFCIGDVSGKGIPASLVMIEINSMFRTLASSEDNPAAILSSINTSMSARNGSMMFVTLFVGVLDLSTGVMQYSNAGHNAPIILTEKKPRMVTVDANLPVGVMTDWEYSLQELTLPIGSILFLYTDGLSEATRSDGELFREERVLEALSGLGEGTSSEILVAHMSDAVDAFVGDAEQSDDLTMLAMRIIPGS